MNHRTLLSVTVTALLTVAAGCSRGKSETADLARAVDQFKMAASVDARKKALDAISNSPCTESPVCETRQTCAHASDLTSQALALKDEGDRGLADIKSGKLSADSPDAQALLGKLEDALRLLKEGHELETSCTIGLAQLRQKY